MAATLALSDNALRSRVQRLRDRLEDCVRTCASRDDEMGVTADRRVSMARRYLLGQASEEECSAIERGVFADEPRSNASPPWRMTSSKTIWRAGSGR